MDDTYDTSLLEKLDAAVPAQLTKFDAFPKLPSTYKQRSESRGFLTLLIGLITFLLILNDIGEFIWGWPDYEFSVDKENNSYMNVNVDLVINMPCEFLSVDLRDAVGDRLYLSKSFRRDGTVFDIGQATSLKEHSKALSARQAIAQSRKSRGFFSAVFRRGPPEFRPTYKYRRDKSGSACRVFGSLEVKKVTANLHVTTAGHGYASAHHADHRIMNLSHIINEFSFGPYFPDITQPLDYSFEVARDPFVAYQYFLHVVPTTYIAPGSSPLNTNQYSVTHYTRVLQHNTGTPGIFFKFDLEPMRLSIHQRTTTFVQFMIRCVGVVGGVFVCMGYAIRITSRAVDVVSGADHTQGTIAAEASGVRPGGLRSKFSGSQLHSRKSSLGRVVRQGNGWVVESPTGGSPTFGPTTPVSGSYTPPSRPSSMYGGSIPYPPAYPGASPTLAPPPAQSQFDGPSSPGVLPPGVGLGINPPAFGPAHSAAATATVGPPYATSASRGKTPPPPRNPSSAYAHFPPSPNSVTGNGVTFAPPPLVGKKSSGTERKDD
jgi:hypothetical protein